VASPFHGGGGGGGFLTPGGDSLEGGIGGGAFQNPASFGTIRWTSSISVARTRSRYQKAAQLSLTRRRQLAYREMQLFRGDGTAKQPDGFYIGVITPGDVAFQHRGVTLRTRRRPAS